MIYPITNENLNILFPALEETPDRTTARIARKIARPPIPERSPHPYLDRPRIQFNWGYWDGIAFTSKGTERMDGLTAETILAKYPDPFYAHGYVMGAAVVRGEFPRGMTSEPAWNEFRAALTDPTLIFRIEANP